MTTLITNHTFSNLVLRPPGIAAQGPTPRRTVYKALGDAMAAQNGYTSQQGYELYDTTGTTEDWTYYATGGLGFTFEIGCNPDPATGDSLGNFHPPYPEVVAQWEGTHADQPGAATAPHTRPGRGVGQPSTHSVIHGKRARRRDAAPLQAVPDQRLRACSTRTGSGRQVPFQDTLDSTIEVPTTSVRVGINPSTTPPVRWTQAVPRRATRARPSLHGCNRPERPSVRDFDTTDETC